MRARTPRGAHSDRAKIKITKISSKGLTSNSAKICTSENFPLYGKKRFRYEKWKSVVTVEVLPTSTKIELFARAIRI